MERADLVYRMAFASVRGMNRALADDLIAVSYTHLTLPTIGG